MEFSQAFWDLGIAVIFFPLKKEIASCALSLLFHNSPSNFFNLGSFLATSSLHVPSAESFSSSGLPGKKMSCEN